MPRKAGGAAKAKQRRNIGTGGIKTKKRSQQATRNVMSGTGRTRSPSAGMSRKSPKASAEKRATRQKSRAMSSKTPRKK